MMWLSEHKISEIIDKNDIVDVISEYMTLKKSGNNYTGLCPFHSEKTPSFSVSSTKQMFYCFGCGVGGNVITFIQKIERMEFVEAAKFLADRAGINIENEQDNKDLERIKELNKLKRLNVEAAKFFHSQLNKNNKALEYFDKRGLSESIIRQFGLGYAPDEWQSLQSYLNRLGFDLQIIHKAGLILPKKDGNGFYDRFRNRVMFPIIDLKGNIIAFGGRVLDDSKPKYLNSPETPIFNKGHNIFGLNFAKKSKELKNLIVVEGYMDVIALHQFGIQNTVASLGTAFTDNQAKLLKRYTDEIVIAYDSDTAGQSATLKGLSVLEKQGCSVKVLSLPSGKDPDEFIRKEGADAFKNVVFKSLSLIEFKIEYLKKRLNMESIQDQIKFTKYLAQILKDIESNVEIDAYIKKYSKQTQVSEEAIYSELNRLKAKNINGNNRNNTGKVKYIIDVNKDKSGEEVAEQTLLNICVIDMNFSQNILQNISEEDFSNSLNRRILHIINFKIKEGKMPSVGEIINYFDREEEKSEIASVFNMQLESNVDDEYINQLIARIRQSKIINRIRELTKTMDELFEKGDTKGANEIFKEITKLQKMSK